jgi:FkbM family methyltransferase
MMKRVAALVRKGLRLAMRPRFTGAVLRHRVAAAVEHLQVIRYCAPATLIDIGANKGQFSLAFRALRPDARILAFEPLHEEADRYQALFAGDRRVTLHRVALAAHEGQAAFHVTNRHDSSSLLKPGRGQNEAFAVRGERVIRVPVKRLDACMGPDGLAHPILIKIDVQGAELQVLEGCGFLEAVDFIYVELSFVELYEEQALFRDVFDYLDGRGFVLVGVFNQVTTDRFGPTQADFLFGRAPSRS